MMQEKDIREKLNQELGEMAPDILNKILEKPVEFVESEEELFGKNEPLFQKKNKIVYFAAPAIAALAACLIIAFTLFSPSVKQPQTKVMAFAYSVTIDVNPSITIDLDEKNNVMGVRANNKDAKKIVKKVNDALKEDSSYEDAIELVMNQLGKKGYITKKKKAMLISVVSDDNEFNKEKLSDVKKVVKEIKKDKEFKCKTVYQGCKSDKKIIKIAEKNNVTIGKAAFCKKISKSSGKKVNKLCKESIAKLIKEAKDVGIKGDIVYEDEAGVFEEEEDETGYFEETTFFEEPTSEYETVTEETESSEETQIDNEYETTTDGN